MTQVIYLVTQGDYSDYRILGAFSTELLAQEFVDLHKIGKYYDEPDIQEYILDEYTVDVVLTTVYMCRNGGFDRPVSHEVGHPSKAGFQHFSEPYSYGRQECFLVWTVGTDDEKRAIKVVNEKRIQILAQDIWDDSEKVRAYFGRG